MSNRANNLMTNMMVRKVKEMKEEDEREALLQTNARSTVDLVSDASNKWFNVPTKDIHVPL